MKKTAALSLALVLALFLAACGGGIITPRPKPTAPETAANVDVATADTGGTATQEAATDPGDSEEGWAEALLGQWHDMDVVGSGYGKRWLFQSDGTFAYAPSEMSEDLNRLLCEHGTWKLAGNQLQLTIQYRIMLVGGTAVYWGAGQYIEGAEVREEPVAPVETKTITIGGFGNAEYYDGDVFLLARETAVFDGVTYYEYSSQADMFDVYFEYAGTSGD